MVTAAHLPGCDTAGCVDGCPTTNLDGLRPAGLIPAAPWRTDGLTRVRNGNDPVAVFADLVTSRRRRGSRRPRHADVSPHHVAYDYGINPSLLRWRDVRDEGRCRLCERPHTVRPLTEHHIVPKSWYRGSRRARRLAVLRNVAANKLPVCRPCHDHIEADPEGRRELRRSLAPHETTFVIQTAGEAWLDDRYPLVRR